MYITVVNKYTGVDVPFRILDNGEIHIVSTNPKDNEDTCRVIIGNVFYPNSHDFNAQYKRI